MIASKLTFVVLLKYVDITVEDVKRLGLEIVKQESDLNVGYFTIQGDPDVIQEFKLFLNGLKNI